MSRPNSQVLMDQSDSADFSPTVGRPSQSSPLNQDTDTVDGTTAERPAGSTLQRSTSNASTKVLENGSLSRGGTLKKRNSLRKRNSLKRTGSRKSVMAASMKSMRGDGDDFYGVFQTPVPTSGNPTEVLANRFQAWRKLLKDLITYFREIQSSYETRAKSLVKVSNVLNNTNTPSVFMSGGGLDDALQTLRGFHKQSASEANKAKDIENDVINQLSGLRNDLGQKIKEIKSLSGDFKNSVDKEKDVTRKTVGALQDALQTSEVDPSAAAGKNDPFIVKLAVDRQVEKQIEEENYLHRAYLNLEGSGRELESIVVGEIQKAYNAYAGILKKEADSAHNTIEELRAGPLAMAKDFEWDNFVEKDPHIVNTNVPLRRLEDIQYPGRNNPAAAEIRAGMLERKSKYLKSYTPGWYVLSATHLHEFKSADYIHTQQPVMSLCLHDQRLGSRSQQDASSHKFSLKGRQTGGMHRGHSWVFRAESYDTMLAWFEDIRNLTEKSGEEKTAFVRRHARSVSVGSHKSASGQSGQSRRSSDAALEEDEADSVPYSGKETLDAQRAGDAPADAASTAAATPKRPEPGGRFPSDVNIHYAARGSSRIPSSSSASSGGANQPVAPPPPLESPTSPTYSDDEPDPLRRPRRPDDGDGLSKAEKLLGVKVETAGAGEEAPTAELVGDTATSSNQPRTSAFREEMQTPVPDFGEGGSSDVAPQPAEPPSQAQPSPQELQAAATPPNLTTTESNTTTRDLHVPGEWSGGPRS